MSRQTYVVLLVGDENRWQQATPEEQEATFEKHNTYAAALQTRGDAITGGQELQPTPTAVSVRKPDPAGPAVITEGPFAETSEQVGAFYVIETDDVRGLAELTAELLGPGDAAEIRPVTVYPEDGS